jgi:hypothetical protein
MAIPKVGQKVVAEPSHHAFEIEQPYEELYEGLQMTGNQGLRIKNQEQHEFETLPRVGIRGLEPEKREELAIRFNRILESKSRDPDHSGS